MVMTGVVQEVGAFDRLAAADRDPRARARRRSTTFTVVFVLAVITPSLLNNDAAILILTPLVVALARRLYPGRIDLTMAFAFAVFLAPGVAPLIVSNPMNMIVAEFAGLGFNSYAARDGADLDRRRASLTYAVLRVLYRDGPRERASRRRRRSARPCTATRAERAGGRDPARRRVPRVSGRRPSLGGRDLARRGVPARSARCARARLPRRAARASCSATSRSTSSCSCGASSWSSPASATSASSTRSRRVYAQAPTGSGAHVATVGVVVGARLRA